DQGVLMGVTILFNHLPETLEKILANTKRLVGESAERIEAAAKETVRVQTGSAQAGIYRMTADHDGYSQAVSEATSLNPHAVAVPKVDGPTSHNQAIIAGALEHNLALELGTVHMSAKPYLTPAAEGERETFTKSFHGLLG